MRVGDNHHHLICRSCGLIVDVDCTVGDAPCLTPSQQPAGFVVDEAEVVYWGYCPSCNDATGPAAGSTDIPSSATDRAFVPDKESNHGREKTPTTTNAGVPVASDEHSLTQGPGGGILLHDHYLIEKMAQFNRERVPERVVHAKGAGAFGELDVTDDVSAYTKADFLQPGKKTEMLARFSTVAGEQGSPDTWRDPRGFALKFYTEEGNYDLVGNNTPVFFIQDPMKFPDFIRSQKRLPDSGLRDHNMQWDFWTLNPESAHQVT